MINLIDKALTYFGKGTFFKDLFQFTLSSIDFLANPNFPTWLLVIKYLFILVTIFFLGIIIIVPLVTGWLKLRYLNTVLEFVTFRSFGAVRAEKRWNKITSRVEEGGAESDYKLAIMEAETMINDILEEMGYSGDSLEERLDQLSLGALSSKKDILEAHKVRNSIARDPDYEINLERTQEVLNLYKKTLKELQVF
ncbi:MAG: hypothetical protein ACOC1P_04145 [Minisyncoccales bacterium]